MLGFLARIFTWWHGYTLGTGLFTWLRGELVGKDSEGNRYYKERKGSRRWVIYNGVVEASRVPAEWNGWLNGTLDELPDVEKPRRDWEKPPQANQTGSPTAHRPAGGPGKGEGREHEAWAPPD